MSQLHCRLSRYFWPLRSCTLHGLRPQGWQCRRAKPGRFGSLAFAMKNRHFGGECSWMRAGEARKCVKFWVFACVPNPGKQSIWRQCSPNAWKQSTKNLPNRPGFTQAPRVTMSVVHCYIEADFWEMDLDSNFSIFGVRRFTEWPGPLH